MCLDSGITSIVRYSWFRRIIGAEDSKTFAMKAFSERRADWPLLNKRDDPPQVYIHLLFDTSAPSALDKPTPSPFTVLDQPSLSLS